MNAMPKIADQADTLRTLRERLAEPAPVLREAGAARVFAVTSGKGGVGKTAVVSNVAVTLGKQGKKVLIIDADLGLANIDVIFGLTPRYNLNHFFSGEQSLDEIMVEGPAGIKILPAGSGAQQFTRLDAQQKLQFIQGLDGLHGDFEYVFIDTEGGISENVTYFNAAAQEVLVVTTPDPTAMTDAYALMKLMSTRFDQKSFYLAVNLVRDPDEGLEIFQRLTMVSNRYLDISIDYLGGIPFDKRMYEAIRRQKPMVDLFPGGKTSVALEGLARSLAATPQRLQPKGTLQFFWNRYLSLSRESE